MEAVKSQDSTVYLKKLHPGQIRGIKTYEYAWWWISAVVRKRLCRETRPFFSRMGWLRTLILGSFDQPGVLWGVMRCAAHTGPVKPAPWSDHPAASFRGEGTLIVALTQMSPMSHAVTLNPARDDCTPLAPGIHSRAPRSPPRERQACHSLMSEEGVLWLTRHGEDAGPSAEIKQAQSLWFYCRYQTTNHLICKLQKGIITSDNQLNTFPKFYREDTYKDTYPSICSFICNEEVIIQPR